MQIEGVTPQQPGTSPVDGRVKPRRVEISNMATREVRDYVERVDGEVHVERKGARTFLVATE